MVDSALQGERFRPLMRREYDELVRLGYLVGEQIELLRGMLVEMRPQGGAHSSLGEWLHQQLVLGLPPDQYRVRRRCPSRPRMIPSRNPMSSSHVAR